MSRPRLLDLFCGAGGAAVGYARAGFEVVGVDVMPQPRYPYEFRQADAIDYLRCGGWLGFDAVHASPPCQRFSSLTAMHGAAQVESHADLIEPIREGLEAIGRPWVIENVEGAPLRDALMLCGSMFDLRAGELYLRRHRLFESNVQLWPAPAMCAHDGYALGVYGNPGGMSRRDHMRYGTRGVGEGGRCRKFGTGAQWRIGMGIDWMSTRELAESIPPAYTEHIGRQLIAAL